jgi:hypothetical protein
MAKLNDKELARAQASLAGRSFKQTLKVYEDPKKMDVTALIAVVNNVSAYEAAKRKVDRTGESSDYVVHWEACRDRLASMVPSE